MRKYAYQARSEMGNTLRGNMQANSPEVVKKRLAATGMTLMNISEVEYEEGAVEKISGMLGLAVLPIETLIMFTRQMYTLSKAGVPVISAMKGLSESSQNETLQRTVQKMAADLESGLDMASAMEKHPKIFDNLYVSIVRVAEFSGRLDDAFLQLSAYLEQKHDTKRKIKSATRYPTFVLLAMVGAIAIVNLMVMPAFKTMFDSIGVELPLLTRVLLASSDFFVAYWLYMLVGGIALFYAYRMWAKSDSGAPVVDRWKLKIPVLGNVFELAAMSRFSRSTTMAIRSDVPLIQTLTLVADAVDNRYMQQKVQLMRGDVEQGNSLTHAAKTAGIFTPLITQMLAVGEETGAIDDLMEEVAETYDRDLDFSLKRLAESIEPFLIVGIGVMVLCLALAIFLPMWDFYATATGKL